MAEVYKKVHCPFHKERTGQEDKTPSFAIWTDGHGYCFGCKAYVSLFQKKELPKEGEKENVKESLSKIMALPKGEHRGLFLHYDDISYYILWPDLTFYKRRFSNTEGPKYYSPKGHRKPLFSYINYITGGPLIITEGELNAMSLNEAFPGINICSPGGATDIYGGKSSGSWRRHISFYQRHNPVYILTDDDKAGKPAGIGLAGTLRSHGIEAHLSLLKEDANKILQERGKDALREEISKILGVSTWV